jgi:integrase
MRKEITAKSIAALEKDGGRISDTKIAGFIARCLPSGRVQFGYQFGTRENRRWITIGLLGEMTPDQARHKAEKYVGQRRDGRDPAAERKVKAARSENTVDYVLDKFLEIYVPSENLRSASAIKQCFANHVRPAIGSKVIYDLRRADVAKVVDKVVEQYPRSAHVVLARLRKAFNWWQLRDEEFKTPIVRGMVRDKTKARTRVLTPDEIADVWHALDELEHVPACFPAFVRLLLLTACRRCEVSDMHTSEIDGGKWTIPAARYKTKVDHLVPLIPAIRKLLPECKDGFVFSGTDGKKPLRGFSIPKNQLDEKIAEIRKREKRRPMPEWRFHDLRRTARTIMAEIKIDRDTAEAVLGHTIGGVEGTYNQHKYLIEKTDALTRLAAYVDRVTKARSPAAAAKLRVVGG